jgi:hypothetical protein
MKLPIASIAILNYRGYEASTMRASGREAAQHRSRKSFCRLFLRPPAHFTLDQNKMALLAHAPPASKHPIACI